MPRNENRSVSKNRKVCSLAVKRPAISILRILIAATALFAVLLTCLQALGADNSQRQNQVLPAGSVSLRMPDGTTAQSFYRNPTMADLEQWSARKKLPAAERAFALQDYGEAISSLKGEFGSVPLTLAQGDFTRDGIPDLIIGSQAGNEGIITLRHGLAQALFPRNTDWVRNPVIPFGREKLFSVPVSPNVIVTGDFNNDGLLDLVISDKQSNSIFLIPGDRNTILGTPISILLPGRPTALLSADLGAVDHLSALVVATEQKGKATVLIFQNRRGAFEETPDQLQLQEPVVAMQAGQINTDSYADLVIATTRQLVFCYGSFAGVRADFEKNSIQKVDLDFTPDEMILANVSGLPQSSRDIVFISKERNSVELFQNLTARSSNEVTGAEIPAGFQRISLSTQSSSALVTAELNGEAPKELILFDRSNSQLSIMKGSKDVMFTQSDTYSTDAAPIAVLPMRLNPTAIDVLVVLKSDGALNYMASPPGAIIAVDTIADDTTTGGTSNAVLSLREAILLSSGGTGGDGITTGLGRALTTGACPGAFETCYISGTFGFGVADIIVFDNTTYGVAGGTIRVSGPAARRALPPIRDGATTIDATAACPVAVPNCSDIVPGPVTITPGLVIGGADDGLSILTSYNVIRGLNITFFPDDGIELQGGISNIIEGCKIGVAGGNTGDGIDDLGFSTVIGGTTAGQSNVISGNLDNGIIGRSPGLIVQGNFIGTDATGSFPIGNALSGIRLEAAATEAIIGGAVGGNTISGNGNGISSNSNTALIQGNIIGRDAANSADIPNGADGINITGRFNVIGGTASGADNAIRGNLLDGVQLGGTNNTVEGNDSSDFYIGGNGRHGVYILANSNTVGAPETGIGNLILGNGMAGVRLEGSSSSIVQGNTIESNGQDGIQLDSTSNSNTIGGTTSGATNLINSNGGAGVLVLSGTANAILSNSIFDNAGLGIDLGTIGVNPNDTGDGDAGPNNLQNFPVLTAAVTASSTVIIGTLNSQNSSTFTLQFYSNTVCDPSGNGEGETFLGSSTITTNNTGNASFTITLPTIVAVGEFITATATHSSNNTSEFSACILVTSCPLITLTSPPLPDGTVGVVYSTTIAASGGIAPYSYSVSSGALPNGLNLNTSTGEISGTPSVPGLYSFDITALDSTGCTGSQSYTINVLCGTITLTAPPLPDGVVGTPYTQTIVASGGTAPYTFAVSSGALPTGLTLNTATGEISGTPSAPGLSSFDITATDSFGCTGTQSYTINVVCSTITLTAPPLPDAILNVPYSTTITPTGGTGPFTFAVTSGALPTDLSLNTSTGEISGTPSVVGLFSFDITATDSTGCTGTQSYTIDVSCGSITLTAPPLPNGVLTVPYMTTITATGGTAPHTFAVTVGSTPPGITLLSDGTLSGTPTVAGSFDFTVTATDSVGCIGSQAYTLVVFTLLFDDFEDGIFTWDVIKGTWFESGGKLIGTSKATAFAPVPWNPSGLSGCIICTIRVNGIVINSEPNARVVGWYVDDDNKVELILKEGKVVLKQTIAGLTVAKKKASVPVIVGVPFDIEIIFDGTNFEVKVDGSSVLVVSPGGTPSGKVGFTIKKGSASFGEIGVQ